MEQTEPKLDLGPLGAELALRDDLALRYGDIMGHAIYDHLIRPAARPAQPNCTDVLELSEIAHRLRQHVRALIAQARTQQTGARAQAAGNVVVLFSGSGRKGEIFRAYRLYKKMNHDFHDMYEACMKNVHGLDPECVRRWYDAHPANEEGLGYMV